VPEELANYDEHQQTIFWVERGEVIDKSQLRELIQDVLVYLNPDVPYTADAVELLMLTAAQESKMGTYLKQIKGPAMGIFQMEPATEQDIWNNFLRHNSALEKKMQRFRSYTFSTSTNGDQLLQPMHYNLAYQIAMARVHYWRKVEQLPSLKNVLAMATYWKNHYNTSLGKGTVEEAIKNYNNYAV